VSTLLPGSFAELVYRLAVGLEPRDAVSGRRIARPVDIAVDGGPTFDLGPSFDETAGKWPEQSPVAGLRRLSRHGSGRFVLLFDGTIRTPVRLRIVPRDRRYVPRRLEIPIVGEAAVLAGEQAGADVPTASRAWRPLLFPGAGYDLAETATGVRGTVTHAGDPVRWTRIEAFVPGSPLRWRAHGDDRGEFLLVLGQNTGAVGDLVSPLVVTITVYAPNPALAVKTDDALADLPRETLAGPGITPDDVSTGITLTGWAQITQFDHPLTLGRLSSVPIAV